MTSRRTNFCSTTDANVASHLSDMAATQPHRLAIACAVSGTWPWASAFTELNFKQLDDWSSDIARGLIQAGIGKGTRVALLVPPGPEFFAVVFALMKAGGLKFEARAQFNANPADTRAHPDSVWSLPPTLRTCGKIESPSEKADCEAPFRAIGESDRMTLRFRKPN